MNTPRWYMLNKMGMATLCSDKAGAEQEAADAQRLWPHMGPHRAVRLVEANFEAADIATASAQGFRDGEAAAGATIATLKGQRAVLCSLLRECLPAIQDLAEETMHHDTEASAYSLIVRIESALNALAEDQVKVGES